MAAVGLNFKLLQNRKTPVKNPFGSVRQVGYVVKDIEAAMQAWVSIGVGPWFYRRRCVFTSFEYRGKQSAFPELSLAMASCGDVQVELVQQRNDAPSLFKDMLDSGSVGIQHIAYWTSDRFDEWSAHLLGSGFVEGHSGQMGVQGRFAYFLNPVAGAVIEISEISGGKAERFKKISEFAQRWDGQNPIREMSEVGT